MVSLRRLPWPSAIAPCGSNASSPPGRVINDLTLFLRKNTICPLLSPPPRPPFLLSPLSPPSHMLGTWHATYILEYIGHHRHSIAQQPLAEVFPATTPTPPHPPSPPTPRVCSAVFSACRAAAAAPASVPRPATATSLRPATPKVAPAPAKEPAEKKAGVNQEYDSFMEEMKGLGAI